MVAVTYRMWKLKQLYALRFGEGAAILPKDISRIHLDFAYRINGGHRGPRKFWRRYLPSLKYHNPAVQMTINRTMDQTAPATLSIFYAMPSSTSSSGPSSSSPSSADTPTATSQPQSSSSQEQQKPSNPAPISTTTSPIFSTGRPTPTSTDYAPTDHVVTIDMKNRQESEILEEFFRLTKAEIVRPTDEDEIERLEIETDTQRRQIEADNNRALQARRKAEEAALKEVQARIAANTMA